jgi:hypothetical protein
MTDQLIVDMPQRPLISKEARKERMDIIIEMRTDGYAYTEIAEFFSITKFNVSSIMRGTPDPLDTLVFIDKTGNVRVSKGGKFVTTHGRRKKPEYYSWYSMKTRCGNPNHADYPWWGGKGITYDPDWEMFDNFYADMGPRPSREYTLERKDNTKGYSKDNCCWLLKRLQNRNQSHNVVTAEQVLRIRREFAEGKRQFRIAKDFGIKPSHVAAIVHRKCWKDI